MDASPTPATPLRIAGISAGAVVGAVLAALQAAGEPLERAADVTRSLDYHRFRDSGRVGRLLGPLGFLADGRPASWPTLGIRLTSRLGEPRYSEPVRGAPA